MYLKRCINNRLTQLSELKFFHADKNVDIGLITSYYWNSESKTE